ncbi:HAD hydrolase-like protein [Roseomonas sp. CCTCC AB2023176]|uniref:HAD hydrolase-like protein n=1 Tax=Roseomonas sp. CCTCC AB2023176 TaxID=3342640 RepID=UPI0035DAE025
MIEGQLAGFGIGRDLYDAVVSSGETTWTLLRDRTHPFVRDLGPRAARIGPARDLLGLEELGFTADATPEKADWVLNIGPDPALGGEAVAPYEPLLERLLARDLPMVCVNPDRAVVAGGRRLICAGALSEWYAARGGRVLDVGKPLPLAYAPVLEALGLPLRDVVAIGDSPHTDLAGAQAAGLDAVWALGGLSAEEGLDRASPEALAARAEVEGVRPVAALRGLVW